MSDRERRSAARFDRWTCWFGRTWVYRLFARHQTELNNFYWSSVVAAKYAEKHARLAHEGDETAAHFSLTGADTHRYPPTVGEWKRLFREQRNWARLSAVMALNSYLEIYLQGVVALALESDPGLLYRAPGSVDGVVILKRAPDYGFRERTVSLVKHDWSKRVSEYRNLFGSVPSDLTASIGQLEDLRRLRNGVGHAFGRDVRDFSSSITIAGKPLQRVAEPRLQRFLGVVERVAVAIDDHLRSAHIGAYEILRFIHERPRRPGLSERAHVRRLKDEIGAAELGSLPGVGYIGAARKYYLAA